MVKAKLYTVHVYFLDSDVEEKLLNVKDLPQDANVTVLAFVHDDGSMNVYPVSRIKQVFIEPVK